MNEDKLKAAVAEINARQKGPIERAFEQDWQDEPSDLDIAEFARTMGE